MAVRKLYDQFLGAVDLFQDDLKNLKFRENTLADLAKEFAATHKKAKAALWEDGGADDFKKFSAAMKEMRKKFEGLVSVRQDQIKIAKTRFNDLAAKAKDVLQAIEDKHADEQAHIDKHKDRIKDAKKRASQMIEKQLDREEAKFDADEKAKEGAKVVQGGVETEKRGKLSAGFDRAKRKKELLTDPKFFSDADLKKIAAADKRIGVYEKIIEVKRSKYAVIRKALSDFNAAFPSEATVKLIGGSTISLK